MLDQEKVIKGLENQLEDLKKYADNDQPLSLTQEQAQEIISLLKEHEPVKPRYTPKSIYSWECGVCAEPFDRIANYCPECGRKVKWE